MFQEVDRHTNCGTFTQWNAIQQQKETYELSHHIKTQMKVKCLLQREMSSLSGLCFQLYNILEETEL